MTTKKTNIMSMNQISSALYNLSRTKTKKAILIGISGIDGAGKGFVSNQIKENLEIKGLKVAVISVDDWHQPKSIRLIKPYGAFNFYANAFRFNELFDKLILPLKKNREINLVEKQVHVHDDVYYKNHYHFENIDVILLEGIFLFKKEMLHYYDFKIWISCDYETALNRAKQRNQEKTEIAILEREYENIYFPAQEIHFQKDDVKNQVNTIFINCLKGNNILQ